MRKPIYLLCFILVSVIVLHSCIISDGYTRKLYEKEELLTVYEKNETLFREVVDVIIHNENFCNDRDSEYDDVFLMSPYDKSKLRWFNEEECAVINDFYAFQPYMLNYHCTRQYFDITFINEDQTDCYVFVFWLSDDSKALKSFLSYRSSSLKQNIEKLDENCYFLWRGGTTLMRGRFSSDKLETAFGYPILTEENTVVKIILKSDMDPVLLNTIAGTR